MHRVFLAVGLLLQCCPCFAKDTEADAKGIHFFEEKIRPVLIQHCYGCHSSDARSLKGNLLLDSREAMRSGGDSGAAVVPKDADASLLLGALRYEDFEMPPKGQLPADVIADFERWIEMGAPDPRRGEQVVRREIDLDAGREFWAFQPIQDVPVPQTDADWPRAEVDHFIFAKQQQLGVHPVQDAASEAWLRRVTFDLTGLPPSVAERAAFLEDDSSAAREQVVDRLLHSSHFGERWGRYWLDLARYAESTGRTRNYPFPVAWRYRDYVIASLNADKPIDQFLLEQLAGDLLPAEDPAQRHEYATATGYLALGSPDLNERDKKVFKMDAVADQIDTVSRSLLGLTVGCARCHDHKFDPIPTEDYYALAGIFQSTERLNGYTGRVGGGNALRADLLIPLGEQTPETLSPEERLFAGLNKKDTARLRKAKAAADRAQEKITEIKANKELPKKQRNSQLASAKRAFAKKNQQFNQLRNRLDRNRKQKLNGPACMGVRDGQVVDCRVHIRGDTKKLGDSVPRGFLQVLTEEVPALPGDQSGRLELAQWIIGPDNPLTARVFVNRVWAQLFGQGLVRTVDNFGAMGARPSHPELLDHLAQHFLEDGWSLKRLLRSLVLSRTYGLDVVYDAHNAAVDGGNEALWRMPARRLDFESMRDAMLMASGELVTTPPTGSPVQALNAGELSRQKIALPTHLHRAVYLPVLRNLIPAEATAFDFPDSSETRGVRDSTIVPTQSLFLMNSDFVRERARATAQRILDASGADPVGALTTQLYLRAPRDREVERFETYVAQRTAELDGAEDAQVTAWAEVVQAMFASAEFRMR